MRAMMQQQRRFGSGAFGPALAALVLLGACARHDEKGIRELATGWFDLGETLYFQSEQTCTAAVFRARSDMVKAALPIEQDAARAVHRLRATGIMAVAGVTADAVANGVMGVDKALGLEVLAAGTQGKTCMDQTARNTFFKALFAPHTVLVYDRAAHVLAILVPTEGIIVIASGEV